MATADLDGLLAQAAWVERFARALVREDSEDVAQDAWLAAIQHPPAPATSPRPWFATVMRNLGRMRFRSAARRRAREGARGDEATVPTPAELAHRMELQRRLATAVLALDEPQRSTIVLVFYEGLSPADVARRQGVPATTVRSRLRAALVTLRDRLDAEEGGQRARWQLALAPLVAPRLAPAAPVAAWPLAVAALAVVATAGIAIAIAVRRDAASAETHGDAGVAAIATHGPALALSSPSAARTPPPSPALAIAKAEVATTRATAVPAGFATAEKTLLAHVDECYEIAHRVGHDLAGVVHMTISLEPKDRGVDASVEIDGVHTTIVDPDFLECIRENATAIEHGLEQTEHADGPITVHVAREMPPTREGTELVTVATDGDDFPPCPPGTALAGTPAKHQWCALPNGTKHGPDWSWDAEGHVTTRTTYDHGESTMETGRPEN